MRHVDGGVGVGAGVGEYDESAAGLHFGWKSTTKCKETCCKLALCTPKCLEIALRVHLYRSVGRIFDGASGLMWRSCLIRYPTPRPR